MTLARTAGLFVLTAAAEIVGCWLVLGWLRQGRSILFLIPAAASLAAFAWLLTFHPTSSGRIYASYGGVYVASALVWLWAVDRQMPDRWDLIGVALTLAGATVITLGPRN